MESKFKQFINDNKGSVVFYLIWFLVHLILLANGYDERGNSENGLWPFGNSGFKMYDYGIVDFIFYLIAPFVLFIIWKLIGGDSKKKIH